MRLRSLALALTPISVISPAGVVQTKPAVVVVIATDYAFQAPDTIPGGLVQFRLINRGPGLHHIWLVRLDADHRAVDVLKGFHEGRRSPAWAEDLGGPNVPAAGEPNRVTVSLTPGRYGLLCFMPDPDRVRHLMKGMVKEITVVGPTRPGLPPRPTVTVRLVENDFVPSKPLRAGPQVIAVRNEGRQTHMLAILRLEAGRVPADYLRWAATRKGPPPAITYGGTTGIAPGVVNTIDMVLKPGEYALMCFAPHPADGKPHAAHGMMRHIRVSGGG
jgi:hypothetical protein